MAAGSIIDENSEIAVVISALNSTRFVPEVLYLSYDEALPILEREGIPHSTLRVYTPTAPGIILWQNIPAGVQMEENITMNLLISDGLPTVDESKQTKVPDFTKMTYDEALAKASENGLYLATEAFKDHSLPLDYITEQDIKAGETLNQGSIIKVKRNTVTGTVTVPKLSGKDISVLKKELEDLYFDVTIEYSGSNTVPKGQVIDSYPTEGMTVDAGSEIVLIVSDGRPTYQMQEMEVPWWWFY